jgi:restriction system protein
MGYQTELTKYTGDGGIDIFARSSQPIVGGKIIVQCKRYAPQVTVGEPVLRDLYGLVISSGANKGLVVTTSSFTPAAVQFALGKPLELIDGDLLTSLMRDDPSVQKITTSFELD